MKCVGFPCIQEEEKTSHTRRNDSNLNFTACEYQITSNWCARFNFNNKAIIFFMKHRRESENDREKEIHIQNQSKCKQVGCAISSAYSTLKRGLCSFRYLFNVLFLPAVVEGMQTIHALYRSLSYTIWLSKANFHERCYLFSGLIRISTKSSLNVQRLYVHFSKEFIHVPPSSVSNTPAIGYFPITLQFIASQEPEKKKRREKKNITHTPESGYQMLNLYSMWDYHYLVSCFWCEHSYFPEIVSEMLTCLKMLINLYRFSFFFYSSNYILTDIACIQMKRNRLFLHP